jgi:hypothetical protein
MTASLHFDVNRYRLLDLPVVSDYSKTHTGERLVDVITAAFMSREVSSATPSKLRPVVLSVSFKILAGTNNLSHIWTILHHLAIDPQKPIERIFGQVTKPTNAARANNSAQDLREYCAQATEERAVAIIRYF